MQLYATFCDGRIYVHFRRTRIFMQLYAALENICITFFYKYISYERILLLFKREYSIFKHFIILQDERYFTYYDWENIFFQKCIFPENFKILKTIPPPRF